MQMCISCFATSAGPASPMWKPIQLRQCARSLDGQYDRPLRIIALNADEGWSKDVSEAIAAKVREVADHEDQELTSGTLAFIEEHIGRISQPTLPLW